MNVFIIGLGLIGGSFALDIQQAFKNATIYGIDSNEEHGNLALERGIIHQKAVFSELSNADIIIIAIPVDVSQEVILKTLDIISDDCLVFDVGSTKEQICNVIKNHPKRRNFLATHPIAGTEFSGPNAALKIGRAHV